MREAGERGTRWVAPIPPPPPLWRWTSKSQCRTCPMPRCESDCCRTGRFWNRRPSSDRRLEVVGGSLWQRDLRQRGSVLRWPGLTQGRQRLSLVDIGEPTGVAVARTAERVDAGAPPTHEPDPHNAGVGKSPARSPSFPIRHPDQTFSRLKRGNVLTIQLGNILTR